ncbi:hypothetical protein AVEN_265192-1 [Araneus ventricosus]|uniref:Uncharacterized protein n=1 Tax=Araneus ventricosus TaxID=182803 RepID=A0A4Y2CQE4_ARAVE|nr:hypothetical protein AVEN_265192-1 [Araneus ventricosus]
MESLFHHLTVVEIKFGGDLCRTTAPTDGRNHPAHPSDKQLVRTINVLPSPLPASIIFFSPSITLLWSMPSLWSSVPDNSINRVCADALKDCWDCCFPP